MTTTERRSALERPIFWMLLLTLIALAGFAWLMQRSGGSFRAAVDSVQRASSAAVDAIVPDRGRARAAAPTPAPPVERPAARMADLELKAAVQQALLAAPSDLAGSVTVEVEAGQVILEGQAADTDARYRAELVARSVPGVTAVENRLAVPAEAPQPAADERLAKAVEFELYLSGAFDLSTVQIVADNGTVRLGGMVRSTAERLLAERVAGEVEGVERVINALELAAPVAPAAALPAAPEQPE